jgi:hypothetical protein
MFKGKTSKGVDVSSTYGFNEVHGATTWILVTHRTGAKLFESTGANKPLEFPREFAFPEGKVTGSETYREGLSIARAKVTGDTEPVIPAILSALK